MQSFAELREANVERLTQIHPASLDWSIGDWGCALAGEVGELCNLLKKTRRGEDIPIKDIAHEIADVQIYLDIIAYQFGLDLAGVTAEKFNITSAKLGATVFIQ